MTTDHPKFSIHTALQLFGLTTEKLLPTALKMHTQMNKGVWWVQPLKVQCVRVAIFCYV